MSNRFFPNYPNYKITSCFGMRTHPVDKVTKMHNGIDLVATNDGKTGQVDSIMAHTGGTVDAVGYTDTVGNYINIRVDKYTIMVYRHLRYKPTLQVGETVKQGQKIGYMGKTGNATGAHLHWGIQRAGEWIDPEPYLDKDYPVEPPVKYITMEIPALKRGMKGDAVRALQAQLVGLGYDLGDTGELGNGVDGSFGEKTEKAVIKYQRDHNLKDDGSVGRQTRSHMMGLEGG